MIKADHRRVFRGGSVLACRNSRENACLLPSCTFSKLLPAPSTVPGTASGPPVPAANRFESRLLRQNDNCRKKETGPLPRLASPSRRWSRRTPSATNRSHAEADGRDGQVRVTKVAGLHSIAPKDNVLCRAMLFSFQSNSRKSLDAAESTSRW